MEPVFLSTAVKIFLVLVYSLILLLAFILANRRGRLLVAWLFVVLTLILPPSLVVENEGLALNAIYQYFQVQARPGSPFPWWAVFLAISFFYLPVFVLSFGLVVGTLLFSTGMQLYFENGGDKSSDPSPPGETRSWESRLALDSLVMSGLVLAATLYNLYWLLVLDRTTDSIGIFWLFFTAPVLVACAAFVYLRVFHRVPLPGLVFAILLPGAFIAVSLLAGRVDYRALTEARAERIARAIQAYHAREGRYPEGLVQLFPRYLLVLPDPVIINGQSWCYESDVGSYLFGYVDREHWSNPNLFGHLSGSGGAAEDLPELCAAEIATIQGIRGW